MGGFTLSYEFLHYSFDLLYNSANETTLSMPLPFSSQIPNRRIIAANSSFL
jgi:hypothetical protein